MSAMDGKVCLITGASNGIGLETAAALASMGATVVMTARDPARGQAALEDVRARGNSERVSLLLGDFASLAQVRALAAQFREHHDRLHVLVNNAGAYHARRATTHDGFEMSWGVNHLAYFLLTGELLDMLTASAPARIVNVSSAAHLRAKIDFDDVHGERSYGGMRAYGQSKLANVLFTYELARRLEGTGVTANCVHPGVVRTGFGRNNDGAAGALFATFHAVARPLLRTPGRGAETSIYLASSPEVEGVSGKYFFDRKPAPSSPLSHDEDLARRLWALSEEQVQPRAPA